METVAKAEFVVALLLQVRERNSEAVEVIEVGCPLFAERLVVEREALLNNPNEQAEPLQAHQKD